MQTRLHLGEVLLTHAYLDLTAEGPWEEYGEQSVGIGQRLLAAHGPDALGGIRAIRRLRFLSEQLPHRLADILVLLRFELGDW